MEVVLRYPLCTGELAGEFPTVGLLLCMFNGHGRDSAILVQFDENIFVDIPRVNNPGFAEVDHLA